MAMGPMYYQIDLHIPAGSKTSFVGVSGSGKNDLGQDDGAFYGPIKGILSGRCQSQSAERCANISTIFPSNRMFLMQDYFGKFTLRRA